jgi:UDP-glucuronate 4-epimerase
MAILVTGGAGFIGSHLVEMLLARSDESILCLDDFNPFYDPAIKRANVARFSGHRRVRVIEGTFCDAAAMHRLFAKFGVRRVLHLGAQAGVRPSVADPFRYEQVNVAGTLALLEAARAYPVERFVLASSSTVYGRGAVAPFREDAPLGPPLSPYGATKQAAEIMAQTYRDLHGVPIVVLRPFSVYGPRLRPDLAMCIFLEAIERGRPFDLFGDGSIRRDFTHVSDVCEGFLAALVAEGVVGEAINLGHHEPIEIRRLIRLLEDAAGRRAIVRRLPEAPGDMPFTCADVTKASRLLGYRPSVPIDRGVSEFVAWYRRRWSAARAA